LKGQRKEEQRRGEGARKFACDLPAQAARLGRKTRAEGNVSLSSGNIASSDDDDDDNNNNNNFHKNQT